MKMKLKNRILAGLLSLAVVAGDLMPAYALGSEDEPVVAVESAEEQEAEMTVPLVREGAFPEAERFTPDATALATYFTPEAEAAVISALKSRATTIDISAYKVPKADVGKFYFGILNSHPDLFYVDGGFSYNYNDTYATKILPRYSTEYSQADIDLFYETVDRIIDSIDSDWSKLEKVLYLHDYLVTHCDYQKTQPYTKFNAYNALVEGDSVCQGYAEAFECLLQRIGVDGQVVTSEGINHAWNVLSLDGKWYYIDCTWDDPLGRCGPYCGHSNLLRSREGMTETGHTSTDWVGAEDSSNIYGTIPGATTYDSYFWSEIDSVLPLVGHKTMIVTETSGMFYDFSTKNSDVFSITTSSWPVKGNPYSHWVGTYSNVVAVNGVFYYSTCDSIYSCTTSKEQEKVYELSSSELSKGYIYGLSAEDPYVKYWLKTSPNDSEYAATGKTKVSSSTPKTKAATPTASPASGATLEVGDQISLSCATSGARIYYTTDGSAPSTSSTLYTAKISVPASCAGDSFTIKAIAVADGYLNSAVGSFTYTVEELPVLEQAPAPAASPASGTVLKVGDTIRLSSTLEDAQIRYTTDGSNPTETSALYGSAIIVSEESAGSVFTVKAIVTAEGYLASDVASFAYIVEEEEPEQTAAPVASPVSGTTLSAGDAVSLSCATEGAVIRYTTDGSSPTAASALYESPIIVPASSAGTNFTIKAIAYGEGCVASEEAVFIYPVREDPVEEKTSAPTADPESGTLLEVGDSISLNCVSENALIYYTTDGSEPDESATVYTEPIVVSESFAGKDLTIKAFAVAEDLPASNIAIFVYSVKAITPSEQTAAPVATPASGSSLMSGDTITLSCTTANAKIYYTTDGTLPTEASTLYGSPIEITDEMAGTTVKIRAIAVAEGYLASNAVIFVYTVEAKPSDEKTAAPKADPADGTGVAAGDEIVLSCATEGAKIYYTTKEGTPIGKYTYYIAPITIPESYEGKNFTIKAYAVADPLPESAVVSFTYPVISKTSAPVAAPASGSRLGVGDTVKLSCATEGAVIHYTIGADNAVSETSPVYSEPIAVTLDMIGTTLTINALAVGKDQPASTAVSFSYTVEDRSKIELDKKSIRFTSLDKTEILTAKVYGPDGKIDDKAEVTFESKDPSVATVSANGTVIPVANGKTVVTARSGKLSADCAVSVFLTGIEEEEIPVYRVDFYNDKLLLKSSDVQRGSYVKDIPEVDNLAYWYDNDLGAVWNASSPVTKDLTLYAILEGSDSGEISALDPDPRQTGDQYPDPLYLVKGQKFSLNIEGAVSYSSDNNKVVAVSKKGVVTAKNTGFTYLNVYGAGSDPIWEDYPVYVILPTLSDTSVTLVPGASKQLTIDLSEGTEDASTEFPILWVSSAPSVASVNDGEVFAISKGSATISAYINGKTYSCKVKVADTSKPTLSVEEDEYDDMIILSRLTLQPMQNTTLKLSPINFKNLEWSSLDGELDLVTEGSKSYYRNDYVKIDKAAGKIYAIGSGSCTLSFTDEFYNYLLPVTVVQPQEQRVYVNNDKTAKLKFYGVKNNAARYESSDNSIVTVDAKGKIKGIKPGVAVITCYYPSSSGDNSGFVYRARVFVENPALKETDYLKAGKNQYSYTININRSDDPDPVSINFRSDGNYRVYQPLVFKSNKPAVAFVNEFGFLEINGPGKATITTKVNGKKITIKVVVQ